MNSSVAMVVRKLQQEKEELEKEVSALKKTLQYRHTTINDLRYSKRLLMKALRNCNL